MKALAGSLIRDARERRQRTNDEVAKAIGVDPSTLSRLEQGKITHPPAPDVLAAIQRELGVSPFDFLRAWGYEDAAANKRPFPIDSERAALAAIVTRLDEDEAEILRMIADGMIRKHEARRVAHPLEPSMPAVS